MIRAFVLAAVAFSLAGCLAPGGPGISVRDTNPPRVLRTLPGDRGQVGQTAYVQIIFSEPMDPRSLEAGVTLLAGNEAQPIELLLPPPGPIPEPVQPESPYAVRLHLTSGPWPSASAYTLVMGTLLTDTAGNSLEEEVRVILFTAP